MSLTGNAESNYVLRGKLTGLKTIHGYSAYEIAVINGFDGTEEEWLDSLVGKKGDRGEQGDSGVVISTKEPTGENRPHIWLNPEGDATGEIETSGVFVDAETGRKYKLFVESGNLKMVEVTE